MKLLLRRILVILLALVALAPLQGCKSKDPSVIKVFVRNTSGNEFVAFARVTITADVESNDSKIPYGDTLVTNTSGYAEFNVDRYFEETGKKITVGYFDVIVKSSGKQNTDRVRARKTLTNVTTIYLD